MSFQPPENEEHFDEPSGSDQLGNQEDRQSGDSFSYSPLFSENACLAVNRPSVVELGSNGKTAPRSDPPSRFLFEKSEYRASDFGFAKREEISSEEPREREKSGQEVNQIVLDSLAMKPTLSSFGDGDPFANLPPTDEEDWQPSTITDESGPTPSRHQRSIVRMLAIIAERKEAEGKREQGAMVNAIDSPPALRTANVDDNSTYSNLIVPTIPKPTVQFMTELEGASSWSFPGNRPPAEKRRRLADSPPAASGREREHTEEQKARPYQERDCSDDVLHFIDKRIALREKEMLEGDVSRQRRVLTMSRLVRLIESKINHLNMMVKIEKKKLGRLEKAAPLTLGSGKNLADIDCHGTKKGV